MGLNAQRASIRVAPRRGWIVKGRYKTVEQGNRVASSEIGFGTGSPLIQVEVALDEVQNGRQRPILFFGTNRENSGAPGGVTIAAATPNLYANGD
jgi:predicted oxidoreductase